MKITTRVTLASLLLRTFQLKKPKSAKGILQIAKVL